jgi:formate dehydrogenase major subunit
MYNRASADPSGKPWSEKKKYIWWDSREKTWVGNDKPDFALDKSPEYEPDFSKGPRQGMDALDGKSPFIMSADGKAWLFVPSGLKDGPLPTHYEPVESPVKNRIYERQDNPVAKKWERPDNPYHDVGDPRYPYVITSYRLTEHHSVGIPTRMVPSTAELQPEAFAELSPDLARLLGVNNLDWVVISTARGEVEAKALVSKRLRPLEMDGTIIHQVGLPWHFGRHGYATGDIVNTLSSIVGDPNTTIHEGKAFTCNVRKGRLVRGTSGVGHVNDSGGRA